MSQAISADTDFAIRQFLGYEALLLDEARIAEWIALLDPAIVYEMPLRIAAQTRENELRQDAWRIRDTLPMLRKRLERLATSENWAENPASRTVRNIGSIFIEPTEEPDIHRTHSALTLFRQRATDRTFDWIAARRVDLIRETEGRCTLVRRTVILAETVLQLPSLSIFL
jgi:3-phenylpropionate/cinnamic acid dioxygenase small subunit